METSDSALPLQLIVIDPPAALYDLVNGAGPCGASVVELVLDDELEEDDEDEELDDVLGAGGLVGADWPPSVTCGGAATVEAGIVDSAVPGAAVAGGATVVEIAGSDGRTDVSGAFVVRGTAEVDGTAADVSGASDVDG